MPVMNTGRIGLAVACAGIVMLGSTNGVGAVGASPAAQRPGTTEPTSTALKAPAAIAVGALAKRGKKPRQVMMVGNNWAGTATVIDVRKRKAIKTLNMIPDRRQELLDIYAAPDRLGFYLAIQQAVGEGHDQYVDDMFTTRDGALVAVSRPSFSDVVWIDLATGKIVAEQQMNGYRTDHMGVSPDGRRLLVSDSTDRTVHEYVMGGRGNKRTGKPLRTFESGDTPHESNYTKNGHRIVHASIGRVYTPGDEPLPGGATAAVKGDAWLQIVTNKTFTVKRRWDMNKELAEAGHPDMSSAVRPMVLTPDQRTAFLQVSFFHGIVEFSLRKKDPTGGGDYVSGSVPEPPTGRVVRLIRLPISEEAAALSREEYVLDSAHHGIAINKAGTRLCVAGTMSDYAAIVNRKNGKPTLFAGKAKFLKGRTYSKPYWATTSHVDGNCWVSMAGSDLVMVIDYAKRKVIAEVPVGLHPQRVRDGLVARKVLRSWRKGNASSQPDLTPIPITPKQQAAADAWVAKHPVVIG